ncbi:unnamed protein product [Caenorhabditis brenneri]
MVYKKSQQKKNEDQKRRTPIVEKLLGIEYSNGLKLETAMKQMYGLKVVHAQAKWLRNDLKENLWKDSEEYGRYSREEKRKLGEMVGLEPSPDTAVFSDAAVKQVNVPTLAGMVGVLANHVPTIGVLKPGVVSVTTTEGSVQRLFVFSGTLSVNIDGSCQVLAEEVLKVEDIDESAARAELESAQRASEEGSEVARAEAQGSEKTTEYLESLKETTERLQRIDMAQSVPPGDIHTQPNDVIMFNAPFTSMQTSYLTVINPSTRTIAFALKSTIMKRLGVDPPWGVIEPKKAVLLAVSCDAFAYGQENTNNDRITIEWTNTPDGAAQQFRREWFQGNGIVRRKSLSIDYNGMKQIVTPEDTTQNEKSEEGSPELTLTSKLKHMTIRIKEEEEAQEKRESEEVQEKMVVEQKQKKETKDVFKSKSSPPQFTVIQFIQILEPYIHATLPQEECCGIDDLLQKRASKRKNEVIDSRRLHHLTRNVLYTVEETAREAYKTNGIINFSVASLLENTKKLVQQLGMEDLIEDWEVLKLASKPDDLKNMVVFEDGYSKENDYDL